MTIDRDGRNAARIRRGYIVTRRGVHIGLTAANTQGDFSYVKLATAPDGRGWAPTPACISINDAKPAACGSLLMDTGVTSMYLTVPASEAEPGIRTIRGGAATLAAGMKLKISIPGEESPQAFYIFTVGDQSNPLAPARLDLVDRARAPFVNTSVRFLNGFDYLYDADGGFVGLRWTGHASPALGKVMPSAPSN